MAKVTWHGDEFVERFKKEQVKNLTRAAIYLSGEIKKELSKGVKRKKGIVIGRSAAGDPPALEEGELRRSIAWTVDSGRLIARVGTNKIYGKYLELGTRFHKARPFLRSTMKTRRRMLAKIMAGNKIKR